MPKAERSGAVLCRAVPWRTVPYCAVLYPCLVVTRPPRKPRVRSLYGSPFSAARLDFSCTRRARGPRSNARESVIRRYATNGRSGGGGTAGKSRRRRRRLVSRARARERVSERERGECEKNRGSGERGVYGRKKERGRGRERERERDGITKRPPADFGAGQEDDPMSGAGRDPVSTRGRPRPRVESTTTKTTAAAATAAGRFSRKCAPVRAHVLHLLLLLCPLSLRAL